MNGTTNTQLDIDNTDYTSSGDKTFAGAVMPAAAIDVSSYQSVVVAFVNINTTLDELSLLNVRMECYYA